MPGDEYGFEVLEVRLGIKIRDTPECLKALKAYLGVGFIQIDPKYRLVTHWYGDADGEGHFITAEKGRLVNGVWHDLNKICYANLTPEQEHELFEARRRWVEDKFKDVKPRETQ